MNTLQEIKDVTSKLGASRVILFGSRARNAANRFSDYDILAVFDSQLSQKDKVAIASQIRKRMAEHFIDIDVLVRSKEDIEHEQHQLGSVIRSAMQEGVAL